MHTYVHATLFSLLDVNRTCLRCNEVSLKYENIRLKELKSSCNADCNQLATVKELLKAHDIALGAVNIGSATGNGENTLVRNFSAKGKQESTCLQCDLACGGCGGVLQYNNANFEQAFTALMRTLTTSGTC